MPVLETRLAPEITVVVDERAARRSLRVQIDRLEAELAGLLASTWPPVAVPAPERRRAAAPRLLGLGELERIRDELAARSQEARAAAVDQAASQAEARALLDAMLADPPAHKWTRLSNADLGRPGCRSYHVLPRLGPVGLLSGWWRVKISSGCPLSTP